MNLNYKELDPVVMDRRLEPSSDTRVCHFDLGSNWIKGQSSECQKPVGFATVMAPGGLSRCTRR